MTASDGGHVVYVTGGAGFLGSNLCRVLLDRGDRVVSIDNYSTGFLANLDGVAVHPSFTAVNHDITQPFEGCADLAAIMRSEPPDRICNLASPASPPTYQLLALETLMVGSVGMRNVLDLALSSGARVLQASTSEVYGDPDVNPQPESYWGRVNPIGPRSMYDESKRFAEALCTTYARVHGVEVRLARIFNTYGPGLSPDDGRVVTNFVAQALRREPLTVYGDGTQTRSFCFVDDEIRGLVALLDSDVQGPVNIGNPNDFTMLALASLVLEVTGSDSVIEHRALPGDDPLQRRPDIRRAQVQLGWEPTVMLREGIGRTVAWFRTLPQFATIPAISTRQPGRTTSGAAEDECHGF